MREDHKKRLDEFTQRKNKVHLRFIDSCITQLKAQGPSRTCNESKKEDYKKRLDEFTQRKNKVWP